jgi:hypothetical protein
MLIVFQMSAIQSCFSTIAGGKIDRTNGIISGVSAITANVSAKGHGIFTDGKTLSSALEVASEFENGVKVKLRHKMTGEFQSVIDSTIGVLKSFKISDGKLIADLHLLKSLSAETKEKIFEMAEVMPDQFGLSIVFSGVCEEIDGKKFLRCEELQSIDLSDNPAANPDGLFEAKLMSKEIKYKSGDSGAHHDDCMCSKCEGESTTKKLSALETGFNELKDLVKGLAGKAVGSLSFEKDGKTIQLSAAEISAKLEAAEKLSADAAKSVDETLRKSIIGQMDTEGRVPMNPATKKAYTLSELNALPMDTLKFAAINSPVIPLEAKSIYRGEVTPKIDPKLKGSEKVIASWETQYSNLEEMMKQPVR